MTPEEPRLNHLVEATAASIAQLTDKLRLKAHLAGMDAKEEWTRQRAELAALEARLREGLAQARDKGGSVPGEVRVQLHLALREVQDSWRELEPRLGAVVERLDLAKDALKDALREGKASREDAESTLALLADEEKDHAAKVLEEEAQHDRERRLALERLKARGQEHLAHIRREIGQAEAELEGAAEMALQALRRGVDDLAHRLRPRGGA